MTDPRVAPIISAVSARYPAARIEIRPCPGPYAIPLPDFLIILDAPLAELRAAEGLALRLIFAAYVGEDLPYAVCALTPARAEEYFKGPPEGYDEELREAVSDERGR